MSDLNEDPIAGIGHNKSLPYLIAEEADLPQKVSEYLTEEYSKLSARVKDLLDEARELPHVIEDDDVMGRYAKLIKGFRDLTKEIESHHAKEKAPYFRSAQSADNFFFTLWGKCMRRGKGEKAGAADVLQSRLEDYNQRKLAAERARREAEERRLRREAEEARQAEIAAARKAEEDRLAAERARKPETIESKTAVADVSEQVAAQASADADLAVSKAQEARADAAARPADMVRARVDDGPTVTMGTETYATVEDYDLLDIMKLRPFIAQDALDKALRAWAKTTNFNVQMPGAVIGRRPKTRVV